MPLPMDPRFRKNHQLHMLLNKRTYVSDQDLYEMMRSKRVYRAQNDLRRELEKKLQAIGHDRKVKVAHFMVQRATFVRMMAAREKSLRHLLDVKRELGPDYDDEYDEDSEDEFCFKNNYYKTKYTNNEQAITNPAFSAAPDLFDEPYFNLKQEMFMDQDNMDTSGGLCERGADSLQNGSFSYRDKSGDYDKDDHSQSTNKEWMDNIVKRQQDIRDNNDINCEGVSICVKDSDNFGESENESSHAVPSVRRKHDNKHCRHGDLENYHGNASAYMNNTIKTDNTSVSKQKVPQTLPEIKIKLNGKYDNNNSRMLSKSNHSAQRGIETSADNRLTLPKLKKCPQDDNNNIDNNKFNKKSTTKTTTANLFTSSSSPSSIHNGKSPSSTHVGKSPEPQERERTVSMLFIEEDNDDDELIPVSPFDVEAYLKYYRQKRGYSIIISSQDLHQSNENQDKNGQNSRPNGNAKKIKFSRKRPTVLYHSWGVKPKEGENPRERRKEWYQNFLAAKNSRNSILAKQTSRSRDHLSSLTNLPHQYHNSTKGIKIFPRKTPSSTDSQIIAHVSEMRLQHLKERSQNLRERVAQFVAS